MPRWPATTLWLLVGACGGGGGSGGATDAERVQSLCEKERTCDPEGFASDYGSLQGCVDESAISEEVSAECQEAQRMALDCVIAEPCASLAEGACAEQNAAVLGACLDDL